MEVTMLIQLDAAAKTPIYVQIIKSIKTMIMTGKLFPHQQITSVRALAKELQINPNTVQKAYSILEKEGIIYSVAGKGGFVSDNAAEIKEMKKDEIRSMFQKATIEARDSGMWIDEIFTLVDDAYSQ